jgi:general stress protein CsbA
LKLTAEQRLALTWWTIAVALVSMIAGNVWANAQQARRVELGWEAPIANDN